MIDPSIVVTQDRSRPGQEQPEFQQGDDLRMLKLRDGVDWVGYDFENPPIFSDFAPEWKYTIGKKKIDIDLDVLTELLLKNCLLYTSPSPRDRQKSRMPSSA